MRFNAFVIAVIVFSCEGLKPETTVDLKKYDTIEKLMADQHLKVGENLEKEVSIGEEVEKRVLKMDVEKWEKELSFLKDINPNQSKYVGALEETILGQKLVLKLKENEKGALKVFSFLKENDEVKKIEATLHEDKDVYIKHQEIAVYFNEGIITEYEVGGYQKILFKDTIQFRLHGRIN